MRTTGPESTELSSSNPPASESSGQTPGWRGRLEPISAAVAQRTQGLRDWYDNTSRPKQVASVGVASAAALTLLVGAAGWSDEVLAFAGETVFRVGEMPPVGDPDERTTVHDRDGEVIGVLTGPENRESVPIDELPDHLILSVLATEDQKFFEHEGVSVSGIARAAFRNLVAGGVEQGGSTITQQYVKNALLTSERSLSRKITEATWAVRLEQRQSKREILQAYLDIIYLGDGTYGVGAASNHWFNKDARELTLADSALLAGMIRAPEATNPSQEPEAAQARRDTVLDQMAAIGAVTAEEAEQAKQIEVIDQLDVTQVVSEEALENGHVLEFVKQTLLDSELLGRTRDERSQLLFSGGLTINTTLDLDLVGLADATLREHLTDPVADPMGGIVSIEPATGNVIALAIGPKEFGPCAEQGACTTTTVNPLAPGMGSPGRQVGSAFKPIVTAAALASGIDTDWHTIVDSGQSISACGDYRPENYDRSNGVRDLPGALAESNNVFHVKLGVFTGLEDVVDLAGDLGITNELNPDCSLSLGSAEIHPIEMASAYATFANGGVRCEINVVDEILDRTGKTMVQGRPDCDRVVEEDVADQVTTMLQGVVQGGTAGRADIGRPVAAKTGTTNDNLDAWLVGFTPELATAAWVGFEIPEPMEGILGYRSISGGTLPAVLWAEFMRAALDGTEAQDLPRVKLARYATPDCPPPPPSDDGPVPSQLPTDGDGGNGDGGEPEQDGDGDQADAAGDRSTRSRKVSAAPAPAPEQQPTGEAEDPQADDGYDAQSGVMVTETDGDSFEKGHQPERCNAVAPPGAYDDEPTEEPTEEPSQSEDPTDLPTDDPTSEEPSEEPTEEPTTEEPSEEPTTEEPSEEPTSEEPTDPGTR